jgi:hypothetical protein
MRRFVRLCKKVGRKASYRLLFAASAVAVSFAVPASAVNLRPSQLVIFGDSLADAGNLNIAAGTNAFNPQFAGYLLGRFTNGPDYTDLINQHLFGSFTSPSPAGGSNYGFGAARVVDHGDGIPDLALQLGFHFAATSGIANPDALYILNFGGNDVFGLQSGMIGPFADSAAYTSALLNTVEGSLVALSNAGASRILVTGIPNITATAFTLEAQLQARLDSVVPLLGSTELLRFSYQNFFLALAADPGAFGIAPFTEEGNCIGNRPVVDGSIDCTGFSASMASTPQHRSIGHWPGKSPPRLVSPCPNHRPGPCSSPASASLAQHRRRQQIA